MPPVDKWSSLKGKPLILDTSAILSREVNYIHEGIFVPRSVLGEIKRGKLSEHIESALSSISVIDPEKPYVDRVVRAATGTGDLKRLSSTDIEVAALGLQLEGIVVTDDYSIQNVCLSLGIEFTGVDLPTISRSIVWGYRCTGCGRYFDRNFRECPVCGHHLKYFPKKTNKRD